MNQELKPVGRLFVASELPVVLISVMKRKVKVAEERN
jgi:hypothetical protein